MDSSLVKDLIALLGIPIEVPLLTNSNGIETLLLDTIDSMPESYSNMFSTSIETTHKCTHDWCILVFGETNIERKVAVEYHYIEEKEMMESKCTIENCDVGKIKTVVKLSPSNYLIIRGIDVPVKTNLSVNGGSYKLRAIVNNTDGIIEDFSDLWTGTGLFLYKKED